MKLMVYEGFYTMKAKTLASKAFRLCDANTSTHHSMINIEKIWVRYVTSCNVELDLMKKYVRTPQRTHKRTFSSLRFVTSYNVELDPMKKYVRTLQYTLKRTFSSLPIPFARVMQNNPARLMEFNAKRRAELFSYFRHISENQKFSDIESSQLYHPLCQLEISRL